MEELTALERCVLEAMHLDLARAALVASGVLTEAGIVRYLGLRDEICWCVASGLPPGLSHRDTARALFDWLWQTRPRRYGFHGNLRLDRALEACFTPAEEHVGNCLGLTLLYNVLAHRLGLKTAAGHLEEGEGGAPHVFSILLLETGSVDVENVRPDGFDYQGHLGNPAREEWGDCELVADVYHSIANELFAAERLSDAVAAYSKALWLNPLYARARLNRGMALALLGREGEARRDLGGVAVTGPTV